MLPLAFNVIANAQDGIVQRVSWMQVDPTAVRLEVADASGRFEPHLAPAVRREEPGSCRFFRSLRDGPSTHKAADPRALRHHRTIRHWYLGH